MANPYWNVLSTFLSLGKRRDTDVAEIVKSLLLCVNPSLPKTLRSWLYERFQWLILHLFCSYLSKFAIYIKLYNLTMLYIHI